MKDIFEQRKDKIAEITAKMAELRELGGIGNFDTTPLEVSSFQVYPLKEPMGKTFAICRVMLCDQIQLTGIRIVLGFNGFFVSYPNDPGYKGEDYHCLYYPVTATLRDHIQNVLLTEYAKLTKDGFRV